MTNPQKKKKKNSEELLTVWTNLKEKIKRNQASFQSNIDQIFIRLISDSKIIIHPPNEHFTLEEIIAEAKTTLEIINNLEKENYELRKKLNGDSDDDFGGEGGPTIEEVD